MEQADSGAEPGAHHRTYTVCPQDTVPVVEAAIPIILGIRLPKEPTLVREHPRPVQTGRMGLNVLRVARTDLSGHLPQPLGGTRVHAAQYRRLPQDLGLDDPTPRILPPRQGQLGLGQLSRTNPSVLVPRVRCSFRYPAPVAEHHHHVRPKKSVQHRGGEGRVRADKEHRHIGYRYPYLLPSTGVHQDGPSFRGELTVQ